MKVFARSDAAQLAELVARADAGELKIDVAGRRPLTDLAAVHDEAVVGRLPGKTVLIRRDAGSRVLAVRRLSRRWLAVVMTTAAGRLRASTGHQGSNNQARAD